MRRGHSFTVAIRADASREIGTGHVMRCLTIADALKPLGADCLFICRPHSGNLMELIRDRGYTVVGLPRITPSTVSTGVRDHQIPHGDWLATDWQTDATQTVAALNQPVDLLIVDHYALDDRWERVLRQSSRRIMAVDDLADRAHDCDLILDQNLGSRSEDYEKLVPRHAKLLVGPDYALLRPEFAALRDYSLRRRRAAIPSKLLVTLGGVDKDNVTSRVLEVLDALDTDQPLEVMVVMGPKAPWLDDVSLRARSARHLTSVVANVGDMARLMADADIAIGAAGSTSWERCALGLPTVLVILAQNQIDVGQRLASARAAQLVELDDSFGIQMMSSLQLLLRDDVARGEMIESSAKVCDGTGVLKVAGEIMGLLQ